MSSYGSPFPAEEAPAWDPGRSLGIIGLIFSLSGIFCFVPGLVGAVICTVALLRSRRAGQLNKFAVAGIAVGLAFVVINTLLFLYAPLPGRS